MNVLEKIVNSVNSFSKSERKVADVILANPQITIHSSIAALAKMADVSVAIMEKNNLKSEDIAYLVPHQANMRIIQATADRMGVSLDKVMVNIDKYGNTTSATIPSCVSEYYYAGKLKKGDNLILTSFGAGYTWGSVYLKWAI